jgi:threonine synthase
LQGTKTFAYEVWEQLPGHFPDAIVLPVGNGTLLLGAYIGFQELFEMDLIDRLPRLIGVQASACAPLYEAYRLGMNKIPAITPMATLAEGIAIASPLRAHQILAAIKDTGGAIIAVDDAQIRSAWRDMAQKGYYIEPTAAAAIAGVVEFLRTWDNSKRLLSVFTGHGLKANKPI